MRAREATMDELKYNAEHYHDKTAQKAVRQADYEADMARLNTAIKAAQHIFHDYGFSVVERIVLEDKRTGKIYR